MARFGEAGGGAGVFDGGGEISPREEQRPAEALLDLAAELVIGLRLRESLVEETCARRFILGEECDSRLASENRRPWCSPRYER